MDTGHPMAGAGGFVEYAKTFPSAGGDVTQYFENRDALTTSHGEFRVAPKFAVKQAFPPSYFKEPPELGVFTPVSGAFPRNGCSSVFVEGRRIEGPMAGRHMTLYLLRLRTRSAVEDNLCESGWASGTPGKNAIYQRLSHQALEIVPGRSN